MHRLRAFFRLFRAAEDAAFAPLVEAALALDPAEIPAYLDDLRRDAPTVAMRLGDLLARTPLPEPVPVPAHVPVPRVGLSPRRQPVSSAAQPLAA